MEAGAFVLGPFETWNFTTCLACGYLAEYRAEVDAAFDSGASDRGFGLILRFVDENGNGLPDTEDYFVDFEVNVYYQAIAVYEKKPGANEYKPLVSHYEARLLPGQQANHLAAQSSAGGASIALYVNGAEVETLAELAATSGQIGFVVGGGGLAARFDNFAVRAPP